jgi:phytoene desaturase
MLEGVERIEPGVGPRFLRFLAETSKLYTIGLAAFVDRNVHRRRDFFNLKNGLLLLRARAMERLQKMVGRYFKDARLQQAFSFQSLYLGLSPYESPAIYSLLPYTEVAGGLYFPMGGMHAIPRALARLAGELGVDIEYGVEVSGLERDGRVLPPSALPTAAASTRTSSSSTPTSRTPTSRSWANGTRASTGSTSAAPPS